MDAAAQRSPGVILPLHWRLIIGDADVGSPSGTPKTLGHWLAKYCDASQVNLVFMYRFFKSFINIINQFDTVYFFIMVKFFS